MTEKEESDLSSVLDNPVVFDAVVEVISLVDTGYEAGFIDGRGGKPVRQHPPLVPALFQETYSKGHIAGTKERDFVKEWRSHLKRRGCCREESSPDNVVESEVKVVDTTTVVPQQQQGFFRKYGAIVASVVISGTFFGTLCLYLGKVQERKRCMDVKRDMGIPE